MNIQKSNRTCRLKRSSRSAFTLVELLLVISIIAVLSSLAVGIMGSAQNDARLSATRARILTIEKMFEVELEDYEVRRSPVKIQLLTALTDQIITDNNLDRGRFLIHLKNLKRLFTADLIRTEMPNGRADMPDLGGFPSPELLSYLTMEMKVPFGHKDKISIFTLEQAAPASANTGRWSNWRLNPPLKNDAPRDPEQKIVDSAELLYQIISQLEFDGTSGLDTLGSSAIGDTDGDSQPEIVDAWGEPIAFQFQQQGLFQIPPAPGGAPSDRANGVWRDGGVFTDLEVGNGNTGVAMPVQPSQIRLYLRSEKLVEADGELQDYVDFAEFQTRVQTLN